MNYGVDLVSNPQLRTIKEHRRRRFIRRLPRRWSAVTSDPGAAT